MDIKRFPPEVLAQILCSSSYSALVIKLWMCGSLQLNANLASGITSIELSAKDRPNNFLPQLLHQLRSLRHLSLISVQALLKSPSQWPSMLSGLSSTLEELEISAADSRYCLRNHGPQSTDTNPVYIETPTALGLSTMIDLKSLFPRLLSLKLGHIVYYGENDFVALPSSLTHLSIGNVRVDYRQQPLMSILPRSLLILNAELHYVHIKDESFDSAFLADWQAAPPDLQRIASITLSEMQIPHMSWIPRTVNDCKLVTPPRLGFTWTLERIRTLPPLFESLYIAKLEKHLISPATWTLELPKQLKSFKAHLQLLPSQSIPELPKSLTKLKILQPRRNFDWSEVLKPDFSWPPLQYFFLFADTTWIEHIKLLPKTLTKLILTINDHLGSLDIDGDDFPPNLTDLTLATNKEQTVFQMRITNPLPPKITKLFLAEPHVLAVGLESQSFDKLPSSLLDLNVQPSLPQREDSIEKPPILLRFEALHTLTLSQWLFSWGFGVLPRALSYLKIANLFHKLTPEAASQLSLTAEMPPSLTHLDLYGYFLNKVPAFSPSSFANLPNLKVLSAHSFEPFPSAVLRSLPRDLRIFALDIYPMKVEDLPFIPTTLNAFQVAPKVFEDLSLAPHWPASAIEFIPARAGEFLEIVEAHQSNEHQRM